MSSALRILLALIAGLALGAGLAALASPWLEPLLAAAAPVGTLWINALRMTVVPLVFALLVTGVASAAQQGSAGGVAGRTLLWFLALLAASGLFGMAFMPLLAWLWPAPEGAVAALQAAAVDAAAVPPPAPLADWLVAIVPTNPIASAAAGELLPLSLFALLFGFALSRLAAPVAAPLLASLHAVVAALMKMIGWVLWLGPLGVFALALDVGARSGLAGAGALAHYVLLACALLVVNILLCYPLAWAFGRGGVAAFARAALPVQVMAASTRSSLACLPAMLAAARGPLRVPEATAALVLPMAVSLFRITNPAMNVAIAMYGASLLGVDVPLHLALAAALIGTVVSLGAVGLPGQVSFFNTVAPPWLLLGLPLEFLPLLLAVESIPDIFRTIGNVTGDLAVVHVIAAREPPAEADATAGAAA